MRRGDMSTSVGEESKGNERKSVSVSAFLRQLQKNRAKGLIQKTSTKFTVEH